MPLLIAILALVPLLATGPSFAATIPAASCSRDQVEAAFNAAQAGDTVFIPAGTCEWTQPLTWTAPADVTVIGAGDQTVVGGGDRTVIVDKFDSHNPVLTIWNSGGTFRMTALTLRDGTPADGNQKYHGLLQIGGGALTRLDHIHYDGDPNRPGGANRTHFGIETWFFGVVDHSLFSMSGQPFIVQGSNNQAWAEPTGLGGPNYLYLESNIFDAMSTNKGTAIADCYHGGKYVARRNEMRWAGTEMHPTAGNSGRGCRATEVYQNNVTAAMTPAIQPAFNFYWISSGVNMIWGNDVPHGFTNLMTVHSMRRNASTYGEAPPPEGWGYCGTSFSGVGSNWDGNIDPVTGYPCMDQPGQGQGDLLVGDRPTLVNETRGCDSSQPCANPRQKLEPLYEWSNNFAPEPGWGGGKIAIYEGDVLAMDRDVYEQKASFNGSSGTGVGPLANRPASCTKGVYYWATDDGEWDSTHPGPDGQGYQCTATNTWDLYYRPLPFPHPLITGTPFVNTPAGTSPANIRVFPNPWRSDKHTLAQGMTFNNFNGEATVKIFTTSGHQVKSLIGSSPVTWFLDNKSGDRVASGIYLYLIETLAGQKQRGKLAVIK